MILIFVGQGVMVYHNTQFTIVVLHECPGLINCGYFTNLVSNYDIAHCCSYIIINENSSVANFHLSPSFEGVGSAIALQLIQIK
jgi:hypothetical protein